MSRNRLELVGFEAFMRELRELPATLADEGGRIVTRRAATALSRIAANYRAHRVTGNLEASLELRPTDVGRFGAGVRVRAKARHAHLFEYGTVTRQYNGANRGAMPPAPPMHAFVPVMEQERRAMYGDLGELLERKGLETSGRA